jgi:hypothetical protein
MNGASLGARSWSEAGKMWTMAGQKPEQRENVLRINDFEPT